MSGFGDSRKEENCPRDGSIDDALEAAQYIGEQERIAYRRKKLGIDLAITEGSEARSTLWGLALSGGGIRSATFSLGLLQAMARADAPDSRAKIATNSSGRKLLPHFDYLSTVSGGGYIGAFFCSLFQGGRLRPYLPPAHLNNDRVHVANPEPTKEAVQDAARMAYEVLRFEPPGRIDPDACYDDVERHHVGDGPTAWLRENGRYLTPSGAGDMFYGIAIATRNWLSLHFVIGMPILGVLALLNIFRTVLDCHSPLSIGTWQVPKLCASLWILPIGMLLLLVMPLVLAFWLHYSKHNVETDETQVVNLAFLGGLATLAGCIALLYWHPENLTEHLRWTLLASAAVIVMAMVFAVTIGYVPTAERRTVRVFRIHVTRWLSTSIICTLGVAFLVATLEASSELYLWFSTESPWLSLTPTALLGGIVWLTRAIAGFLDERSSRKTASTLSLPYLAVLLAVLMLCLTLLTWGTLLHWLLAVETSRPDPSLAMRPAVVLFIGVLSLLFITGSFLGFINLSSFQALYSARLTRAYLGASNGFRFDSSGSPAEREDKLSVSDALPGDDLPLETYYGKDTLAPLHLINVTVNLTASLAGTLVQRDRKGLPLCIAPGTYDGGPRAKVSHSYSFILDGIPRRRARKTSFFTEADQPLTLGHWIGTSGAAVTTGLGRTTSLSTSLICGLANIRLGTWWPANFVKEGAAPDNSECRAGPKNNFFARILPSPYYLFCEFTARFHGLARPYQYLSDGGHFENTGAYELLRSGRRLDLIILCDCGADPDYRFEDLANLIRLARLDLRLEIEADTGYECAKYKQLKRILGNYEDFLTGREHPYQPTPSATNETGATPLSVCSMSHQADEWTRTTSPPSNRVDDQCALLFNVFDRDKDYMPRRLVCMMLVIKPNLITRLNDDVQFYSVAHPAFPNEPTVDQFFNEAQFESYRQLGLSTGQLLFGCGRANDGEPHNDGSLESYEPLLWEYLDEKFTKIGKPFNH